jgi:hypothetical protein
MFTEGCIFGAFMPATGETHTATRHFRSTRTFAAFLE